LSRSPREGNILSSLDVHLLADHTRHLRSSGYRFVASASTRSGPSSRELPAKLMLAGTQESTVGHSVTEHAPSRRHEADRPARPPLDHRPPAHR
jgi:hypothetical protein